MDRQYTVWCVCAGSSARSFVAGATLNHRRLRCSALSTPAATHQGKSARKFRGSLLRRTPPSAGCAIDAQTLGGIEKFGDFLSWRAIYRAPP